MFSVNSGRGSRLLRATCLAAGLLGIWVTSPAQAQNYSTTIEPQPDSVTVRPRPDFDAAGIVMGSFLLYPRAPISETYDDNVYARQTNKVSDFVTELNPQLSLESQWGRHALDVSVATDLTYHAHQTTEDRVDLEFDQSGRLDIGGSDSLSDTLVLERYQESRESIDDPHGISPTKVSHLGTVLEYRHRTGVIFTNLRGAVDDYSFHDTRTAGGGILNNHDRDRLSLMGTLEVGYDTGGLIRPFVQFTGVRVNFKQAVDDFGLNRDSTGYAINGGILFPVTALVQGRAYAGYIARNFKDAALADVHGVGYGAQLVWSPSRVTTVSIGVLRTVNETTLDQSSAAVSSSLNAGIDQEIRENLVAHVGGDIERDRYAGIGASQVFWHGQFSLNYLMNRRLRTSIGYEYSGRNIKNLVGGTDFNRNQVTLRVRLAL